MNENKQILKLFVVAGEISGDVHAANIVRELKKNYDLEIEGTGGPALLAEGQKQYASVDDLAVIGFVNVLAKLPMLLSLGKKLIKRIQEFKPDLILTVDYNGFNLRFAKKVKKFNIPIVQLVSPHFWIWNHSRVYTMRDYIDKVLCILPFEEALLRKEGVNAVYIGNPVTDDIKFKYDSVEDFRKANNLEDKFTIGILPGSRRAEIKTLMPVIAEAARKLDINEVQLVLAMAPSVPGEMVSPYLEGLKVTLLREQTHDIMKYSDILWACSGTATLEAGIIGTPMIILYKASAINLFIIQRLTSLRMIGLPNIISGRTIVPELIAKYLTPESLIKTHLSMLPELDKYREELKHLSELFSGRTPIKNAAGEIIKSIEEGRNK